MTILEAIQASPGLDALSDTQIEKSLLENNLTGDDEYTAELKKTVDICIAHLYLLLANLPDFSEGSLSMTYSRDELISFANTILDEYGERQPLPVIESVSAW